MPYVIIDEDGAVLGLAPQPRPHTLAVRVADPAGLVKTVVTEHTRPRLTADGRPLYVDAHGVVSEVPVGRPCVDTVRTEATVDIAHDPGQFTVEDVRTHRREELMATGDFLDCLLVDHDFAQFVDAKLSRNFGLGTHSVEVFPGGELTLLFPDLPAGIQACVQVDADAPLTVAAGKTPNAAKRTFLGVGTAGKKGLYVRLQPVDGRVTVHSVAVLS